MYMKIEARIFCTKYLKIEFPPTVDLKHNNLYKYQPVNAVWENYRRLL
jgi:hypothetical protein